MEAAKIIALLATQIVQSGVKKKMENSSSGCTDILNVVIEMSTRNRLAQGHSTLAISAQEGLAKAGGA